MTKPSSVAAASGPSEEETLALGDCPVPSAGTASAGVGPSMVTQLSRSPNGEQLMRGSSLHSNQLPPDVREVTHPPLHLPPPGMAAHVDSIGACPASPMSLTGAVDDV